jgi:four helix bundle protein
VPSNIAEGLEKDSKNEMKRFLGYSISSCAELITQIYIGMEISYIDKQIGFGWIKEVNEIMKMIKTFQKSI